MGRKALELANGLEAAIRDGRLIPGVRLPTHREMAHQHGVALNTASHAMRLLTARGLIVGETGRGSFVRTPHHVDAGAFSLDRTAPAQIDLARNVMPLPGLAERLEAAVRAVLRRERDLLTDYQPHAGRLTDRVTAAHALSRTGHLPDDPSRVLICAGGQHAITVALMATTKPGDAVAVENLTWPGIQAAAAALGLELVPLPLDKDGLRPRPLLRLAARRRITALYCMPTLQNPTAATMPARRRETIAALARRLDFQIIEDDAYGFLVDKDAAPPLAALAPERVWHVRSLSKSLSPGLRTAWLLVPPGQDSRAAGTIRATTWGVPPLGPAIASYWIADGTASALAVERQREARARGDIADSILPAGRFCRAAASPHLWLQLTGRTRAEALTEAAAAAGVRIAPASAFGIGCSPNAVRLSLCAPSSRTELERGLTTLAGLL
ncbi:MAG: PLP-dependent aminotransferase family protein [Acetobacteraceae bacterium]